MKYTVRIYAAMPIIEEEIEAATAEEAAEKARIGAEFPPLDGGWPEYITVLDGNEVVHSEEWQRCRTPKVK